MNEKLSMYIQAIYTKYYFFDAYESRNSSTELHIKSNALQMGLGFKYEYPKRKLRPTLFAGFVSIWLPGASFEEITDHYYSGGVVRPSTKENEFISKCFGFEVSPGIHYYLANERIVFVQAQYLRCGGYISPYVKNIIRSLGISAGIYF